MNKTFTLLILIVIFLMACGTAETPEVVEEDVVVTNTDPATLTLVTHDSFVISETVIEEFQSENNVTVAIVPAGDAGEMLNQAILANDSGAPLGDVIFGVDNTFMGRALDADMLESYTSANLGTVADEFKMDDGNYLTPISYGEVCLNYDLAWFAENGLDAPSTLEDLADPAYTGLTVSMNPATSSPGLAFLLTTISAYGEDGYLGYWDELVANDLLIVDGWSDAYWGHFTGASDGNRPIVVSYASSPPAEVFYSEGAYTEPPTAAVTTDGTCFRQVEFAGILKGSEHVELAGKFIDFMLSKSFQEDIPLNMFVFPANQTAELPQLFVDFATISDVPATLAPDLIDANRESWIETWSDSVLR